MSKPLGRDRLGRLVYENDLIRDVGDSFFVRLVRQYSDKYEIRFNSEVDLVWSPKRSNYERYFADLGTLDDVIEAWAKCLGYECSTCPFNGWGWAFSEALSDHYCDYFPKWLEEAATI